MLSRPLQSDQKVNNLFDQIRDLNERLTQLERDALTSQDLQAMRLALGNQIVGNLQDGDIASDGYIYNANLAFGYLISSYLGLPGLVGFWPMSVLYDPNTGAGKQAGDLGPSGLHLTNAGTQLAWILADENPTYFKIPCANFGAASTDRLYHSDHNSFLVTGGESDAITYTRGLTAGAWVRWTDFDTNSESIIGQWDSGSNDRAWFIYCPSDTTIKAYISSDGSSNVNASFDATNITNQVWHFVCIQWSPSSQSDVLRIWVDGSYGENSSPGVATLHNSAANFGIGHSYNGGSPERYFEGQISMAFLAARNINTEVIRRLYEVGRLFFRQNDLLS